MKRDVHYAIAGSLAAAAVAACSPDSGDETKAPTYYSDVKPIIDGRCMQCHTEGGIAPFALEGYQAAKDYGELIRAAVTSRQMPPWSATNGCNDYRGDFSLTDEQIDTIARWVDSGAEAGEPKDAAVPLPMTDDLFISRVDLTLPMPESYVPAKSPDDYRCFLIDWPYQELKYVTGFNARPGNGRIVHHVIAFLLPPAEVARYQALDDAEPGTGYTCYGGPGGRDVRSGRNLTWLGGWAPGARGFDTPEGTGIPVQPGSKIALQIHYNVLAAGPEADLTEVDLRVSDTVEKPALIVPFTNPTWLQGDTMLIPAGQPDVMHEFAIDPTTFRGMNEPFLIHSAALHMHELGTRGELMVKRKDGSRECLLRIDDWDFQWQSNYRLRAPVRFEPGDELSIECHWNNTAANQPVFDGTKLDARDVTWGEGTTDEMCLGVFYVSVAD